MATHQITVELSDETYEIMQRMIGEEGFTSEREVFENALVQQHIATLENAARPYFPWAADEVSAMVDEADAHPEDLLTLDQVKQHFARKRKALVQAA